MSALAGKNVLVTGADGFIGSHLAERLCHDGAKVRALCYYNSQGHLGWLNDSKVRELLDVRLGDIRDADFVADAARDVEIVFHLAALISIPYSYQAVASFIDTNITGTLNVLRAVRQGQCARLVHTSTSEVYGTPDTIPITERHALNAQSPYAASKIAADQLAQSFHLSFGSPVVTLRPFNTYGPRQSSRAILATILSQLLGGCIELKLGRLEPRRDLTFVADTVDGFVRAATAPNVIGRTIQLGTGRSVSIGELVDICRSVTERDVPAVVDERRVRPGGSEVLVLQSDPSLALELLGWRPSVTLEDGVAQTAAWMRTNIASYSPTHLHY